MPSLDRVTIGQRWRQFHDDEDGLETLQIVMIAGLAALIMIVIVAFWKDIRGWFKKIIGNPDVKPTE